MEKIKAIETSYKGYHFRSRLEARWAVFFDNMGIKWEYEPEGFTKNEIKYLPDFLITLPTNLKYYCEIKSENYSIGDDYKVGCYSKYDLYYDIVNDTKIPMIFLNGIPKPKGYTRIYYFGKDHVGLQHCFIADFKDYINYVDDYWMQYCIPNITNGSLDMPFFYDDTDEKNNVERRLRKHFGRKYLKAYNASRSARFEYGECE